MDNGKTTRFSLSTGIRVWKNAGWLGVIQAFSYALPLLVFPHLVIVLGVDKFGEIVLAQSIATYLTILCDYGFALSAPRSIAVSSENSAELNRVHTATLIAKLMLLAGAYAIAILLIFTIPIFYSVHALVLISFLSVAGSALYPLWLFQGIGNIRPLAITMILSKCGTMSLVLFLVSDPEDQVMAMALLSIGPLTAAVGAHYLIWKYQFARLVKIDWIVIRATFQSGWSLFLSRIGAALCTAAGPIVLGITSSVTEVGIFGIVDKIIRATVNAITPISHAFYPQVSRLIANNDEKAVEIARLGLASQTVAGVITAVILAAALLIAAPHIPAARSVLEPFFHTYWIMCPLPLIISLSTGLGLIYLLGFGHFRIFSRILILGGIANLTVLYVLSGTFGAYGAATASLLGETLIMITMAFWILRNRSHNKV